MAGSICTTERCPVCAGKFKEFLSHRSGKAALDMGCETHQTVPRAFFIRLYIPVRICPVKSERNIKIYYNDAGYKLTSYTESNRILERIRGEMDQGTFVRENYLAAELGKYMGRALLPRWLAGKEDLSPTHKRETARMVEKFFLPYFADKDMRKLNTLHVDDFATWLDDHRAAAGTDPLSLKSKKNLITMLGNFARWLLRKEIIIKLPQLPRISPPDPEITWVTKDTQKQILARIPESHRAIFLFMMYHPVRVGEARALKVKDIDRGAGVVHVCRAFSLKEIRSRKNGKDYFLPLSGSFDMDLLKDKHPDAWVFVTPTGKVYTKEWLSEIWRKTFKGSGLRYIPLKNATRHSIASQALNRGVPLEVISKALGHSSLQVTLDRYARMEVESMRDLVDGGDVIPIRKGKGK